MIGNVTDDLYAIPMKKCDQRTSDQRNRSTNAENQWNSQNELPPGWEKHEGMFRN